MPRLPLPKKPKLVPGWKRCYRWFSTQSMTTAIGIQGVYALLDDTQKAAVGPHTVLAITIAVLVLGLIGNIIKQNLPKE